MLADRRMSITFGFMVGAALLALALSAPLQTVASAEPTAAELFDRPIEDLRERYDAAEGAEKLRLGLILADYTNGELGDVHAQEILDRLPGPDQIEAELGVAYRAYLQGTMCSVRLRQGRPAESAANCEAATAALETIEDPFIRARIAYDALFVEVRRGQLDAAFPLSRRAIQASERSGSRYALAASKNGDALILLFSGLHQEAVSRFEEVRELVADFPDRSLSKIFEFNLGLAYMEVGNLEQALASFTTGAEWAEATGQPHRMLIGRTQMARAYLAMGQPERSRDLLKPLLEEDREHDPDTLAHAWLVYARAFGALGMPGQALDFIDRGLTVVARLENPMRRGQLELGRLEILRSQGRIDEALARIRNLIADLRTRESDELDDALYLMSELAAAGGDYELAHSAGVEAREVERESQGAGLELRLSMMEAGHALDNARREADMARQREQALRAVSQRNNLIFFGAAAALVLGIGLLLLDRARRRQTLVADRQRQLSQELEVLVSERTEALEQEMAQRIRGEEGRRELERQLAEADKMRALGQLTGGVAHDFNNLLTVVSSAAEMIGARPDMSRTERTTLIEAILRASDTGREVNRGLLSYARQQPLTPEPVELEPYLLESRQLFERTIGPGMLLETRTAPGCIKVDRSQLTTAIINLLLNARDASSGRGTLSIEMRSVPGSNSMAIEVHDFGCGMTPNQVDLATEPFFSTKDSTESSGLGLSMVYGFVSQSGGELEIVSKKGQGTTVRMVFPSSVSTPDPIESSAGQRLPGDAHVLLVDDNGDVARMLGRMLEHLGARVTVATRGAEALEIIERARPDILISDVLMPGQLNGIELADAARRAHPDLPILLVSGFAEQTDLAYPMLAKPCTLEALEEKLVTLVGRRGLPPRGGLGAGAGPAH